MVMYKIIWTRIHPTKTSHCMRTWNITEIRALQTYPVPSHVYLRRGSDGFFVFRRSLGVVPVAIASSQRRHHTCALGFLKRTPTEENRSAEASAVNDDFRFRPFHRFA
ncbi:hypothetical protein RchiOBHm_Chr6g0293891 [Rosa chinensis]|uniref:Uncharacterized protein n=1 Tax=Rosa chinensis TaxID=74649 RepID=A0A2P6PWR6_ROSCH|nr:hypothetical protein RchiOBHm_Chr6g0293891 [Rosa chinensis]